MKSFAFILIFCTIAFLSCQHTTAQVYTTPSVLAKYNNTDTEDMIGKYKARKSVDIRPSTELSDRFNRDFPGARDIEWETAANIYNVEFEINNVDYEAYYDSDFKLFMYAVDIRKGELPAIVINSYIAKYPDYNLDDSPKAIYCGGGTYYKIELEKARAEVKVLIDDKGSIVKEFNH